MSDHVDTDPPSPVATATPTSKQRVSFGPNYRKVYAASVISNLGDGVAQIGYPWLASAVTRNPILIALVAVAQRLPWLLFTLPAGVITDRVDRRKLIVAMDLLRGGFTLLVGVSVLVLGGDLPAPDDIQSVVGTQTTLYVILVVASLLLGMAEVLRDNSAQTIIPAIVAPQHLEKANGRMWSAEMVTNTFIGPPLGSLLIAGAFFLPFAFDAVSFVASASLVFLVVGQFRSKPAGGTNTNPSADTRPVPGAWKTELKEGVRWLWHHPLLRPMAIILGCLNAIGTLEMATLVLFAQEILDTSPIEFAVLSMGGALGGVLGGYVASAIRDKLGSGPSLWLTLAATALTPIPIGLTSWWPVVFVMFAITMLVGIVWNVITVSLRQTIIPDHLLGRVNSVYRFFAWGMMPIGTAIGGITVALVEPTWGREAALRAPWFVAAGLGAVLMIYAVPRLTSKRLDDARAEGIAARESHTLG